MMLIQEDTEATPRVVVVEDDPSIAWLIAVTLADEGYAPVVAHDGRAALRAVKEHRPDVVTLDLQLPDLDGRAVLRHLDTVGLSARQQVVIISSDAEWLTREERLAVAGALSKPFNLGDLVRIVRDVTERRAS